MFACFGGSFFGGKGATYDEPATVTAEDTIVNLRKQIERQEKRERFVEHKAEVMGKEAKQKLAAGDKKGALVLMKKRKLYQSEAAKIGNVKMTLETQCIHLESATSTQEAFQAMSAGNNQMQKIRHDVGVENVDDLMMDMQEEFQNVNEINDAIGQSVDPMMGGLDEDDLMAELEGMDAEDLNAQFDMAQVGKQQGKLPAKKTSKDEEDLKKLQAELAF